MCQIFTDVDGVYTTDPRLVPTARKLDEITYDEMLELASLGAQVLHNRSVEMAKKFHVDLEVLSSLENKPGTKVKEVTKVEKMLIKGVAKDDNVARISVMSVPDVPGIAYKIFSMLAAKRINVDIILQSVGRDNTKDISFTVEKDQKDRAIQLLRESMDVIKAKDIVCNDNISKVSIVGSGMQSNPRRGFPDVRRLYEANINIHMISTSEIKISVLIDLEDGKRAITAIHDAFFSEFSE